MSAHPPSDSAIALAAIRAIRDIALGRRDEAMAAPPKPAVEELMRLRVESWRAINPYSMDQMRRDLRDLRDRMRGEGA
jgi:hypothetical protein